ncbi:MAG TPA: hypothetical protein VIM61_06545 [Chthoniobacterales bacterium]
MNLLTLSLTFIIACASCGHGKSGDWEYQYEVINPGTRSEYVSGTLLYKGSLISEKLQHVITPVGEFVFRPAKGWGGSVPFKWLPATLDQNGAVTTVAREAEVKNLLANKGKGFRVTEVKGAGPVSSEAALSGALEQPPKGVGTDWLYAVGTSQWVNPTKIPQALKENP